MHPIVAAALATPFDPYISLVSGWADAFRAPITIFALLIAGGATALHAGFAKPLLIGTVIGLVILWASSGIADAFKNAHP